MAVNEPALDAATAKALRRDVTIVISPKDRFSTAPAHLDRVRALAPGVRILHVLCGPMPADARRGLEERASRDRDLELLDTRADFANPYAMRNAALAQARTKYVMFLFNDVEPLHSRWLANLHRAAEAQAHADVFQPFIWEGVGAPHATWTGISFLRHRGELLCLHPNGPAEAVDPTTLPEREQPYFVEDHAFLARTAVLARQSILDPGAAYTREYLDMALDMRYRGARTWSVPSSQVLYRVPYEMQPGDLAYFCHRRSWQVSRGSIEYIQNKWGFRYWDDAYSRTFIDTQLASARWTGSAIPAGRLPQVGMMLGIFAAAGYDCFDVLRKGAQPGAAMSPLPAAYRYLADALRGDGRDVSWEMRHIRAIGVMPEFTGDFEARRQAVRSGKLFPIVEDAQASAAQEARGSGRRPAPFALLEVEGIRGAEHDILAALAPHACLVTRERDAQGRTAYRAWLHAVSPRKEDLRALQSANSSRLGGSGKRLHLAEDGATHAVRVQAGKAADGWRLVHCAWRPLAAGTLAALLA
jgi:hypothetical protein